jgi:hypothetical protein
LIEERRRERFSAFREYQESSQCDDDGGEALRHGSRQSKRHAKPDAPDRARSTRCTSSPG